MWEKRGEMNMTSMYPLIVGAVMLLIVGVVVLVLWKKRALIFAGKEKLMQFYFREDGKCQFRKLEAEETFLVEKKNGRRIAAWKLAYKLLLPFAGYGGIERSNVTVSYARDIIFDPFSLLKDTEKPDKSKSIAKPWIRDVAESQGYTAQQESSRKMALSTQVALLGGTVLLMAIILLIIILVV